MAAQFFKTAANFPNFHGYPNTTGPWPQLQEGRKIPGSLFTYKGDNLFYLLKGMFAPLVGVV